jgi:two-component system cell cycle response regulator DivK
MQTMGELPDPEATQPLPVLEDGTMLAGRHVLIVEDDPPSAKLVAVVLGAEGCSTQVVSSAEGALIALEVHVPDVIVLDLVLPLMSGLLFARQVKASPRTARIPIIAVSAFNGSEAARLAREAGCAEYIRKPIDTMSFPAVVRSFLGGSNAE